MLMSHRGSGSASPFKAKYLLGAVIAASMGLSGAHAASFGHSRIVSALGRPLHVEIPVTELTQQELESLRAVPAPASAWQEAGMKPPVALESMRLVLLDGYRPDIKVIQLRSDQAFDRPIVDVLLDISSVAGRQRYQVSLLAHADHNAIERAPAGNARNPRIIDGREVMAPAGDHATAGSRIPVRSGDNMFAIAERNAVQGVTIYQMMIALQRVNRSAFIEDNVNLVKAGAILTMPGMEELTALSDREARRIFLQHMQAFERYRQRGVGADVAAVTGGILMQEATSEGEVTEQVSTPEGRVHSASAGGDFLRLSGGESVGSNGRAPDAAVAAHAASDTGVAAEAAASSAPLGNGSSGSAATGAAVSLGASAGNASGSGTSGDVASAQPGGATSATGAVSSAGGQATPAAATAALAAAANGSSEGNGEPQHGERPHSLLAASGLIASDAAPAKAAVASSSSSSSSASGAASDPAAAAKADDEAALRKGMAESRTRVLELEDNVRHLNEALQKQGHVAAEAALEGARSVSEVIKEAMGLKDTDEADSKATAEGAAPPAAPSSSGATGAGIAGSSHDPAGSAGGGASVGTGASPGARPGSGGAFDAQEAGSQIAPARPGSAGEAYSTRLDQSMPREVEKKVAWWQENLFAIIGGGLALIVLVIVWVLRRAGTAKQDIFESDSPITDAMLREKLSDIDLDLPSPDAAGRRAP